MADYSTSSPPPGNTSGLRSFQDLDEFTLGDTNAEQKNDNLVDSEHPVIRWVTVDDDANRFPPFFEEMGGAMTPGRTPAKFFYANLVVHCNGQCDSAPSKVFNKILNVSQQINNKTRSNPFDPKGESVKWTADDLDSIRNVFWTDVEPLRHFLVDLLRSTRLINPNHDDMSSSGSVQSNVYQQFASNMEDSSFRVADDTNILYVLNSLLRMAVDGNDIILQALGNHTCSHTNISLWQELSRNIRDHSLFSDRQKCIEKVDEVRETWIHKQMSQKGLALTDNEILAVYVYSSYNLFGDVMETHEKIYCRWKQLFHFLTRAILKIYDARVFRQDPESLPKTLYHVSNTFQKSLPKELPLYSTVNSTSDARQAKDFASDSGTIYEFTNAGEALSNGKLIAAPVDWISQHPHEAEWAILPIVMKKFGGISEDASSAHRVQVTKYHSLPINFFGINLPKVLPGLSLIYPSSSRAFLMARTASSESLQSVPSRGSKLALAGGNIGPAIEVLSQSERISPAESVDKPAPNKSGSYETSPILSPKHPRAHFRPWTLGYFYEHPCDICNVYSKISDYHGDLLTRVECPACRRYLLGSERSDSSVVMCWSCKKESPLHEYKLYSASGAKCPKCNLWQKAAHNQWKQSLSQYQSFVNMRIPEIADVASKKGIHLSIDMKKHQQMSAPQARAQKLGAPDSM